MISQTTPSRTRTFATNLRDELSCAELTRNELRRAMNLVVRDELSCLQLTRNELSCSPRAMNLVVRNELTSGELVRHVMKFVFSTFRFVKSSRQLGR